MKGWGYIFPRDRKHGRIYGPKKYLDGKKIDHQLNGKPLRIPEDCEDTLDIIAHQIESGTFDLGLWGKDRLGQFANAWDDYQKFSPCGEKRRQQRQKDYELYFAPYFQDMALNAIEDKHIRDLQKKLPEDLKPSTRRRIQATMKGLCNYHKILKIKMLDFPLIRVPQIAISWMKREQQEKVLEFIADQHQPIMRFLVAYGSRVSESANLEKPHIDTEKDEIVFTERKNQRDNVLPILDEIRPFLKGGKITHLRFIFCTQEGQQYSRQVLYRIWSDANKKAHEKYKTPIMALKNGTRHSKACQLLAQGKSIAYVARWLGDSALTIMRNYGIISVETLREEEKKVKEG